ncbi:MAG: threonine--tRNA ligase, partial [Actinomycetota bacterium]
MTKESQELNDLISITVDGSAREIPAGSTGFDLFTDKSVVAQRIGGVLKDLSSTVNDGDAIESVALTSQDGLNILRHSTAHVLAQAVQRINPEAK